MGQQRLSDIALIVINYEGASVSDKSNIMRDFAAMK